MTDLREKLAGRRVVASISGGKDSAAMSLFLTEQGIEHDRVFLDTGWEHEKTYEYLRGELTRVIGPITELRAPLAMEELILNKGMFPSRQRRFCTQELKVYPVRAYLRERLAAGEQVINAVGIRAAESKSRSGLFEWEWEDEYGCEVWRPIITWTEQQVIDAHRRHGLRPNPLYLMGASRVGCWPCIYARKGEIRLIADNDPARIERLRELEAKVAVLAEARYERDRREWLENPDPEPELGTEKHKRWEAKRTRLASPFVAPTWFQAKIGKGTWSIDRVVEWCRTTRGGTRYEPFAQDAADSGCMRWGLCQTEDPGEPHADAQ